MQISVRPCLRPCLHGVGDPGGFLLFCVPQSVKTKETNPTRPGYPTPCKQAQCCTQFKSPGVKIFCVLYLHYNVAFTFK